jgi:hypothetical protein
LVAIVDRVRGRDKGSVLDEVPPALAPPDETEPPEPEPITHTDDPQKDRWGGKAERNGRLAVTLIDSSGPRYYSCSAAVEPADGTALVGPVVFHLHDTFVRDVVRVQPTADDNRAVLTELRAFGAFTIGAQVKDAKGNWVGLEFDLVDLPDLPKRFKDR